MKKNFLCFSLCFILIMAIFSIFTINKKNIVVNAETNIIVVGEGTITATPNIATINIAVETRNEDLNLAISENNEKTNNIFSTLKQADFTEDDIKAKNFNVYQRFDYSNGEKFIGYSVRSCFEVISRDIEGLNELINSLADNGVNCVEGIIFGCDNKEELYEKAIKIALENAKIKANALSSGLLEIKKITEEYCFMNSLYKDCNSLVAASADISKGTINVSAKVIVQFEEVNKGAV